MHETLYLPPRPATPGSALRKHIVDSHTPVEEVGRIAAEAGVKTLVLSHFVPAENPPVSDEQWLAGARAHFPGNHRGRARSAGAVNDLQGIDFCLMKPVSVVPVDS